MPCTAYSSVSNAIADPHLPQKFMMPCAPTGLLSANAHIKGLSKFRSTCQACLLSATPGSFTKTGTSNPCSKNCLISVNIYILAVNCLAYVFWKAWFSN